MVILDENNSLLLLDAQNLPYYIDMAGGAQHQRQVDRIRKNSTLPGFQWLYTTRGKGLLLLEERTFVLSENTGCLFFPGISHMYKPLETPWSTRWITFGGSGCTGLLRGQGFESSQVYNIRSMPVMNQLLENICTAARSRSIQRAYDCSALLYTFLVQLKFMVYDTSSRAHLPAEDKVQPVVEYIEVNYPRDVSVEEMASVIGVSTQYLCRIFNRVFRMGPLAYLVKYRIHMAKSLLAGDPEVRIRDVALQVGYRDTSYFCMIFRRAEGMSPADFRAHQLR